MCNGYIGQIYKFISFLSFLALRYYIKKKERERKNNFAFGYI